jgi:hypothetical protein
MSILNTRLSRWAQVIAAWRSAGVRTSVLEFDLTRFPRLAGQPDDEIHRLEGHLRGAIAVGSFQRVEHLADGTQ